MSTSYGALLLHGWKIDIREIREDVTKYDPDTGVPYPKNMIVRTEAWIGDVKVIEDTNETDLEDIIEYGEPDFQIAYLRDGAYLGFIMSSSEGNKYLPVDIDDIEVPERLEEYAEKYGRPKRYLALEVS